MDANSYILYYEGNINYNDILFMNEIRTNTYWDAEALCMSIQFGRTA